MEHIGRYLKDVYFQKKSGRLIFRKGNIQKYIFLHDGYLVFSKTNQKEELLGEILFRLGKISNETHGKIEDYIRPGKKLGEVLVKEGIITKEDLQEGLVCQMREIVLNIFPFFEGEYSFQGRQDFAEQSFDSRISVSDLIEDGIRRMGYDLILKAFIEDKIISPKERDFYYRLTEEEKEIFESIKENTTADELLSSSQFNPELFWKSLYLFFCLDLIAIKGKEETLGEKGEAEVPTIGEQEKNIADALELSENLSNMNYYQILGVTSSASLLEIKKAYFRVARKFHPDLFGQNLSYEIKGNVEKVFDQITKAYQSLGTEEKRREYDKKMGSTPAVEKRNLAEIAEVKFRQAKTLYNQERYNEAEILLEEAVRLQSNKGKYYLLLGMVGVKIPASRRKGEQNFLKAIRLEPWNADGFAGLGLLYKKEGLQVKARSQFKKALSLDPEHRVALAELSLIEKSGRKKGLKEILSSEFFGKRKKH